MEEKSEYWIKFEEFNQDFKRAGKIDISDSLEDARRYVNGLTDGWYEFMNSLKETQESFILELSEEELRKLTNIIEELEEWLKRK
tara:strand:- start:114 stop:368 length:255 start_codon:yes stop_codon:yes gene_type:complete